MSIPSEALQKLVQEIEAQAIAAQQQINIVRSQIASKQRDMRLLELTSDEISQVPKDANVYEGVGKMFVSAPMNKVNERLARETKDVKTEIGGLEKRLHYLETTHKNSREHIDQMLRSGGRG
ncbi:hypothetical protein FQN57_005144 [Myotisia sp. PD_48]|nr:hypothetical protein FQN57_005144 [Myotisia sp. PD_48]